MTQVHVNIIMMDNFTPLTYVCHSGQLELAKSLIDMGADVNQPDGHGYTPLTSAIETKAEDMVKLLILMVLMSI